MTLVHQAVGLTAAELDELKVQALEETMVENFQPIEVQVTHEWDELRGLYARSVFLPAGSLVTSRVHRDHHVCEATLGEILVFTVGAGVTRVRAPARFASPPGARRVGLPQADCGWTTYHDVGYALAKARDLEAVEARIFEPLTERQRMLLERQQRQLEAGAARQLRKEAA